MNIFKRLFCRKKPCARSKWDYKVMEKKDANGCTYYTVRVMDDGTEMQPRYYSGVGDYKADRNIYWNTTDISLGAMSAKVRFKCPELAKEKAVEYLRQSRNLGYCKVVKEGKVDAETTTNNC